MINGRVSYRLHTIQTIVDKVSKVLIRSDNPHLTNTFRAMGCMYDFTTLACHMLKSKNTLTKINGIQSPKSDLLPHAMASTFEMINYLSFGGLKQIHESCLEDIKKLADEQSIKDKVIKGVNEMTFISAKTKFDKFDSEEELENVLNNGDMISFSHIKNVKYTCNYSTNPFQLIRAVNVINEVIALLTQFQTVEIDIPNCENNNKPVTNKELKQLFLKTIDVFFSFEGELAPSLLYSVDATLNTILTKEKRRVH